MKLDWMEQTMTTNHALDVLTEAVSEHQPTALFAMFSGGHDSLVTTHITARHPAFTAVVHLNTGIGIEETREFVRATCAEQGWPLLEKTPPRMTYEDICQRFGMMGGPKGHEVMYHRLKGESLNILVAETKTHRHDRIVLSTGVRSAESARRMRLHKDAIRRDGVKVWVNPILKWTSQEVNAYIEDHGLRRNEVVDKLHRSGECLCGSFARPGELDEIAFWYPEVADRIRRMEKQCFDAGLPWNWGSARSPIPHKDQTSFLDLCQSCQTKWD